MARTGNVTLNIASANIHTNNNGRITHLKRSIRKYNSKRQMNHTQRTGISKEYISSAATEPPTDTAVC